jgi:hypothetical protein
MTPPTRFHLLGRGYVTVWRVEDGEVDAHVLSDGHHEVTRRDWAWHCTCGEIECVHVAAVRKISPRRGMTPPQPRRRLLGRLRP